MSPVLAPEVTTRAVIFAVALLALLVAHQVGDHVVQTDRQATTKAARGGAGLRAMAGHLVGYHVTAAALLVGTDAVLGLPISPRGMLAGLGFSALTHGLLDRRWPVRAVLGRPGRRSSPTRPRRSAACTWPTRRCTSWRCWSPRCCRRPLSAL